MLLPTCACTPDIKHAAAGGAFDLPTQVTLTIQYYYYCVAYCGLFQCIIKLTCMSMISNGGPEGGGGRVHGMCVSQCTVCATYTYMYMHIAMETGNHSCGNLTMEI